MPAVRGHGLVISKGLAASASFHPLTPWIRSSQFTQARYRLEMRGDTGTTLLGVGYQTADSIDAPLTAAQLGTQAFLGADGVQYGNDWVDLSPSYSSTRRSLPFRRPDRGVKRGSRPTS